MTPDVQAARVAALAELGLPWDTVASYDAPAGKPRNGFCVAPRGWRGCVRTFIGALQADTFPGYVRAMPAALTIVRRRADDDDGSGVSLHVSVHAVVNVLQRDGTRSFWLTLGQLNAALRVPGSLDAYTLASAVGGREAGARALLGVLQEGGRDA